MDGPSRKKQHPPCLSYKQPETTSLCAGAGIAQPLSLCRRSGRPGRAQVRRWSLVAQIRLGPVTNGRAGGGGMDPGRWYSASAASYRYVRLCALRAELSRRAVEQTRCELAAAPGRAGQIDSSAGSRRADRQQRQTVQAR